MPGGPSKGWVRLVEMVTRDRLRLVRFVRNILSRASEQEAEDVVSDVVLRLLERADLLAQVEDLAPYLHRALANGAVDLLRRRRPVEELSEGIVDSAPTPEDSLTWAEQRRRLDDALDRLSPRERAVWVAVEVEGRKFRELAEQWGEPIGTLLARKNRATKKLRADLTVKDEE